MAIGDVRAVPGTDDVHYVDTGMYDVAGYGSVYVVTAAEPAVVDTGIGADRERVVAALEAVGIGRAGLEHVCLTHVHLDHAGGAGYLTADCPDVTVHVHERGAPHLADPERLVAGTKAAVGDQWEHYAEPEPVPEDRIDPLSDGDVVDLGDRSLCARAAPGHAPHQHVLHDDGDGLLFTGDAAGIRPPGIDPPLPTSPPPQFDLWSCLEDLGRIRELNPKQLCFAHFGPAPYDHAVLENYAHRLVSWVREVRRTRRALGDDDAAVERLAAAPGLEWVESYGTRKASAEARLNARGVLGFLDS